MGASDQRVEIDVSAKIKRIIDRHASERGSLIPILQELQEEMGYLRKEDVALVSEKLKIPLSEIYGVATFYLQFRLEPPGENIIQVCTGTACHVKGAKAVLEAFENVLGIKAGNTTSDKRFTLLPVRCFGACALGPIVRINNDIYSRVEPSKVAEIIAKYER
ncbi:MAG: NADH-quinone oxidoreductase subunit NuoE [Candidatus Micrarchaeia archaeon]